MSPARARLRSAPMSALVSAQAESRAATTAAEMFATHGAVTHDGAREQSTGALAKPTELQVLTHALRGEIVPHDPTDRELRAWMLDLLREAEGRALEFDHAERADLFGAAAHKLEA